MNSVFTNIRYPIGIDEAAAEDTATAFTRLDDRIASLAPDGIIPWGEANYYPDYMADPITFEAYQLEPMEAQITPGVEEEVILGPERFGKSTIPRVGMLFKACYHPGPKLIVYEEKNKAGQINQREFHPALMRIPQLARQFPGGRNAKVKSYDGDNFTIDFTGAGAEITSTDQRDIWADEWDTWPLTFPKRLAQMDNLRKRRRLWKRRGEGSLVICSSPNGSEDNSCIWHGWLSTSRGIWHLACLECGGLLNSTVIDAKYDRDTNQKIGGMRWERDESGTVIEESIRLHCPHCGHQHVEADSKLMNQLGEYVHERPQVTHKRGFVFGGLSTLRGLSWLDIAEYRMKAAKSNDYETQRTWHNSYRGVPVPQKAEVDVETELVVYSHCSDVAIDGKDAMAILFSADTQESPFGWYWIVRVLDRNWNTHLVDCGFAHNKPELERELTRQYLGKPVTYAIIDQGGTNADDVKDLAARYSFVWQYKGSSRPSAIWQESKSTDQIKLLNCDADRLQVMLIRAIYEQTDRANNYWYLPPRDEVPSSDDRAFDYITNILNVRNLGTGTNSHLRQNWTCKSHERRDFFDCEKMLQVLLLAFRQQLETLIANDGKTKRLKLSELQAQKKKNR